MKDGRELGLLPLPILKFPVPFQGQLYHSPKVPLNQPQVELSLEHPYSFGLGFRVTVQGLGFRVSGLGFRFRVKGVGGKGTCKRPDSQALSSSPKP